MRWVLVAGAPAILWCWAAAAAAAAAAQEPGVCRVRLDSVGGRGRQVDAGAGRIRQYAGGGVWAHCTGQVTSMRSDSVAWFSELDRFHMEGSVHFEDSTVILDSDRAIYFIADERLEAYGNVKLLNRASGSVLTGSNLTYLRAVEGVRDTSRLYSSQRPTVRYPGGGDPNDPYVIVGNRVWMFGNERAFSSGNVTIDRSDFTGVGDSARLDFTLGDGELVGNARVRSTDSTSYDLKGRRILFRLDSSNDLEWVQAQEEGDARGAEWRLSADTVEFYLADDQVQGGSAWGKGTRPRAVSETYEITADSLAIDTPMQRLEQVRAYRDAVARSLADSGRVEPDWIAGDTVVAQFGTLPDSTRGLFELAASGSARALYHVFDEARSGPPGINYSRGERIVASFGVDGVERVDVVGEADGVHLEPNRRGAGGGGQGGGQGQGRVRREEGARR